MVCDGLDRLDLVDRAGFEPAAFRILGRKPITETTCQADDLQPAYNDTLYTRLIYRPTTSTADAEGWLNWFWPSVGPVRMQSALNSLERFLAGVCQPFCFSGQLVLFSQ